MDGEAQISVGELGSKTWLNHGLRTVDAVSCASCKT